MKRIKISSFSRVINKEAFDSLFDQLNEMPDEADSKAQKSQLRKWRKLKHQLI